MRVRSRSSVGAAAGAPLAHAAAPRARERGEPQQPDRRRAAHQSAFHPRIMSGSGAGGTERPGPATS